MPPPRLVLHADMDAFYASIEQRDRPELRGKPVIVGGQSSRGVVSAASYEARKFGVRSAMPGFRARELCPHGVFLSPDMAKYARVSDEVHQVFEQFSPDIEPLALDEAFVDISGSIGLFGGPLELGRRLKREVKEKVGLVVSVGIAPSKLVAKLACTFSKPDGFLYVPAEAVRYLLDPLPVRKLWSVGPVLEERLVGYGIKTVGQLANYDPRRLAALLGDRAGFLQQLARGEDDRDVEAALAQKSCGEENTFHVDVTDRDLVTSALTSHAESVARRLRNQGYKGRTVVLKIKLAHARRRRTSRIDPSIQEPVYPLLTRSRTLKTATDDDKTIRDTAVELWDLAGIAEPVRLLGVSVTNIEEPEMEQLDLFSAKEKAKSDRLGPTLDAITAKFGKGVIHRAVDAPEKVTASDRKKRGDD